MHYLLIAAVLACGLMGALLRSAYVKNGEIGAELSTVQTELQDAKTQADSLIAASKQHAKDLARARGKSDGEVAVIRKGADAGCHDSDLDPRLRAAIGLLDPDSQAAPPGPGRRKADAAGLRKNNP